MQRSRRQIASVAVGPSHVSGTGASRPGADKSRWVIQPGRDHEETRMHVGASRPEPSDVGMAKQGGRDEASRRERPDVTSCRDEVAARRGGRAGEVEGRWGCAHIHTWDPRVRACVHVGAVSAAVEWPESRAEAVPAARRPGESSARSHAAGSKQCPQPCGREKQCPQPYGREEAMPTALRRPGGNSDNVRSQAAGRKQCPQPCGREEAMPTALRRPGGSNVSSQAAGRRQCPQPCGGREEGVPAAMRRPGGSSARSQAAGREQSMQSMSWAEQHPQPGGRAGTAPAAQPAALTPEQKCSGG
jgi:hypothetical protein